MRSLLLALLVAGPVLAQNPWDLAKKAAGGAAVGSVQKEVNKRLLAESRKNQCSFKSDSDVLEKGCDQKSRRLANALIDAKKKLASAGVQNFKFEVSGHTDTSGKPDHNKELSQKRADVMKRELVKKGVDEKDIVTVGRGSEAPMVTPDDTPAKKAQNRRYEIQVRL